MSHACRPIRRLQPVIRSDHHVLILKKSSHYRSDCDSLAQRPKRWMVDSTYQGMAACGVATCQHTVDDIPESHRNETNL